MRLFGSAIWRGVVYGSRVSRTFAAAVVTCALVGCGGGGGPVSDNDFDVRNLAGAVSLPENSVTPPQSLTVRTTFGQTQAGADGRFSIPTNRLALQLVTVTDPGSQPVLLSIAGEGTIGVISVGTTLRSLLLLNPIAAPSDAADKQAVLQWIDSQPETSQVEANLSEHVRGGGNLQNMPSALTAQLNALANALTEAVKAGNIGSGFQGARGRDVSPSTWQSGLVVQSENDTDPANMKIKIQNYGKRWVEFWQAPANDSGDAIGPLQRVLIEYPFGLRFPIMGSAPGLLGSLLTGRIMRPSTEDATVGLSAGGSKVRLEAWGPGLNGIRDVSWSDYWMRAGWATAGTMFFDVLGPTLDVLLGVKVLGSVNMTVEVARSLEIVADSEELVEICQEFASGEYAEAVVDAIFFAVTNGQGQRLIIAAASAKGIAITAAQLAGIAGPVRIIYAILGAFDIGHTIGTLATARPMEVFLVSPGSTSIPPPFQVTLSWDRPNDIDLHSFPPNGEHSFYANKAVEAGELDVDDVNGFGPENFTVRLLQPGRYRFAVNYYAAHGVTDNTRVKVVVSSADGQVVRINEYVLTMPNGNTGYPVTGSNQSWWRPFDIQLSSSGAITMLAPDNTPLVRSRAMEEAAAKHKKPRPTSLR